jgi:hypothetical protein
MHYAVLLRAARDVHPCVRAPVRDLPRPPSPCFFGAMARQFEIRPLTSRQRAHIEEQRLRGMSAAFARLERALDNTTRPAWRPSLPDRLAYLQAKFDRRVSDPASRHAAATLIEEWRERSRDGEPKPDSERPPEELTDSELMKALCIRRYGRHVAKPEGAPPSKPARMPRKNR